MLEGELFALLEQTADAAYTVTEAGEIRSWNVAAERLFGYAAAEVVGRGVDDVFDARDTLGTDALAGGVDSVTRRPGEPGIVPNFDLEVRAKGGDRLWVNVSTITFDNPRTRTRLFIRLLRDVSPRRRTEQVLRRMVGVARELVALTVDAHDHAPVDALSEQERRILQCLGQGDSAAAIAAKLQISPQTLRNHLHHVNRKLRTHSRLEAVAHARRRGLID